MYADGFGFRVFFTKFCQMQNALQEMQLGIFCVIAVWFLSQIVALASPQHSSVKDGYAVCYSSIQNQDKRCFCFSLSRINHCSNASTALNL